MTEYEFRERYHFNPVEDKLGAGGFGQVYKAYDTVLDREVAIKMAQLIDGKENLSLMKEVELASKLPQHPNIAHYEKCFRLSLLTGKTDIGILQYYPEGSLATIIKKDQLNQSQKEDLIKGILNGLAFLHEHNILHRDIKPGNILIAKRGDQYIPKIADFGLSRQVDSFEKSSFVNSIAGGSAYYAAPEQLAGENVRANVDLWSFGVLLYELLTGDRPFTATTTKSETENARQEIYGKIQRGDIPAKINQIAEPYQTMIKACLIPDRTKRVQDVAGLRKIMVGQIPDEFDFERTKIETKEDSKEPVLQNKTESAPVFAASTATSVEKEKKEIKSTPTATDTPQKSNWPLMFGSLGLVIVIAAAAAFFMMGGGSGAGTPQLTEEQLWITALQQKDESSYQAYVDAYPQGQYATQAQAVIDSLQTVTQANIKAESAAWSKAEKTNTITAYQNYLNTYPDGNKVTIAKEKIAALKADQSEAEATAQKKAEEKEDKVWARCVRKKEVVVYEDYLRKYPEGRYIGKAKDAIKDLKAEQDRLAETARAEQDRRDRETKVEQDRLVREAEEERKRKENETGTFTDSRDGQKYSWKRMKDGKKWMTENLNYKSSDSYCYDNNSSNCKKYGRLYTWTAAKKACSSGWRLPTDAVWKKLAMAYGGYDDWGDGKDKGNAKSSYKALIKNGSSGFTAQLGGYRSSDGSCNNLDSDGRYWSSTEKSTGNAWYYYFYKSSSKLLRYSHTKEAGRSCRCVQD